MLALVTDGFGAHGGIARYNRDFLAAVGEHEIVVLARKGGASQEVLPPGVIQLAPISGRIRYAIAAIRQTLARRPATIFCGHLNHAPLAARLADLIGARLIVQLHGIEVWSDVRKRRLKALERADLVLAVSRDTRRRVLARVPLVPERVVVLNNTVREAFVPGDRLAARQRFGLGSERVVLTVARIDADEAYKGHDRIIPLLPALRARGIEVTYLIAGEGSDRPRLERRAREAGCSDLVRFLGHVPDEALPDLYRAADLFALPSTGEGFGIAFIEAMACGTPAIGLAEGGASDALGDGTLGVCVSPDKFAEEFMRLVESGARSGQELAADVQARFGKSLFADRVHRHLEGLSRAA